VLRLQHAESGLLADGEGSPARPRQLLLPDEAASADGAEDGRHDDVSSHASRSAPAESEEAESLVSEGDEVPSGTPLFMPNLETLWPAGPLQDPPDRGGFGDVICSTAARDAAARAGGDGNASEGGSSARNSEQDKPRHRRSGGKGRGGGRGFGQGNDLAQGRCMLCDVCDLGSGGPEWACTAADMLQKTSVRKIREKHEARLRTAKGRAADPDRREARYAMYRGVVRWRWADPLGAENRVRLPMCVMQKIRRMFPNPICGPGCDYGVKCEKKGHYVGFRTAEESRALREGRCEVCDLRD